MDWILKVAGVDRIMGPINKYQKKIKNLIENLFKFPRKRPSFAFHLSNFKASFIVGQKIPK
jgi:hypothetical protein